MISLVSVNSLAAVFFMLKVCAVFDSQAGKQRVTIIKSGEDEIMNNFVQVRNEQGRSKIRCFKQNKAKTDCEYFMKCLKKAHTK